MRGATYRLLLTLCGSLAAFAVHAQTANAPGNLLSIANGALIVEAPPSYGENVGDWSPPSLQDDDPLTGWATRSGDLTPKTFVFELAERSEISSLTFSSASAESAERSAKDVKVEISDQRASGYAPVGSYSLKAATDNQSFTLKSPAAGRYIRLTVLNNHGDAEFNELMDFAAWGRQLTHTPLADNSGAFTTTFGTFHLAQTGATAAGCYEYNDGLIENGGFEGRMLRFTWRENENSGPAVMIFSADGKHFTGYYSHAGQKGFSGSWDGQRIGKDVGSCPNWKPGGNEVERQLAKEGRARIYGILFDTGSDHLKDESKTALDQLVATAKSQPAWKFVIEGHTDNVGGDAQNQALSDKRAAAVRDYLVRAGIDGGRFKAQGFGASRPVASNETSVGRSQNRRVEVARQ